MSLINKTSFNVIKKLGIINKERRSQYYCDLKLKLKHSSTSQSKHREMLNVCYTHQLLYSDNDKTHALGLLMAEDKLDLMYKLKLLYNNFTNKHALFELDVIDYIISNMKREALTSLDTTIPTFIYILYLCTPMSFDSKWYTLLKKLTTSDNIYTLINLIKSNIPSTFWHSGCLLVRVAYLVDRELTISSLNIDPVATKLDSWTEKKIKGKTYRVRRPSATIHDDRFDKYETLLTYMFSK